MRIAILDLGTNTFHLLIADAMNGTLKIIHKSKVGVKLGEGAIQNNWIAPKPFRRGVDAMLHFKSIIDKYKPGKIFGYATSAIRSAENGKNFLKAVKSESKLTVRIITGVEEAELICMGVRQCIKLNEPSLIMDIGGGSVEFIIADDVKIYWKGSFNIGAARLLGIFSPSDPIKKSEIIKIEDFLSKKLIPLKKAVKKFPVRKLIGSSGSFDTFAEMTGFTFHHKNVVTGKRTYNFNMTEFKTLSRMILKSSSEERMKMKGLVRMRVDMIVVSTICTNFVFRNFKIKEMHLSKYALKEGAMWKASKIT
jgi:exopolyphosphatase/guanosine-5'-triphosphate,3'-diphosphate pyrophosphatase